MRKLLRYGPCHRPGRRWAPYTYADVAGHKTSCPQWGLLLNKHALWIGVHYSEYAKRWCINPLPGVTFWYTKAGGRTP